MSHVHKSMGTLYGAAVEDVTDCPEPHEWDDRTEAEKAADALADAVEANINRGAAFITAEVQRALKAYREALRSP